MFIINYLFRNFGSTAFNTENARHSGRAEAAPGYDRHTTSAALARSTLTTTANGWWLAATAQGPIQTSA